MKKEEDVIQARQKEVKGISRMMLEERYKDDCYEVSPESEILAVGGQKIPRETYQDKID